MGEDFDPYRILGLPVGADEATVRRRYRELARKHHPDVSSDSGKAHERFVRIRRAYETLSDPDERARWERRASWTGVAASDVSVDRPGTQFEQLLTDGRRLLRHGSLREARDVVAKAIELNPFDADAYRLLGDIYIAAGNTQMGLEMYREAELIGGRPKVHRSHPRESPRESRAPQPEPVHVNAPALVIGLSGAALALFAMAVTDFTLRPASFIAWGFASAFLAAGAGVASGVIEPIDELLGLAEVRQPGRGSAPGGVYLLVVSTISPVIGLAFFVVTSLMTETFSRGIVKIYAVTLAVSVAAFSAGGLSGTLLAFAPSVAFMACALGWFAGGFFTPGEWWRR